MLKRYGVKAARGKRGRADKLAAIGDHSSAGVWRWITAAVCELANTTPPGQRH